MRGFTDTLLMIHLNLFSSSSSGYSLLAACYLEISVSLVAMSGQGWKTAWCTFFTWAKINSCLDFISFSSSWSLECKIICISIWIMQKSHVCLCVCVCVCTCVHTCLVAQLLLNLWLHGLWLTRHPCPWDSPDKHTRVGCHSLLQGIFLIHGLNLGVLHCRQNFTIWATRKTSEAEEWMSNKWQNP